MKTTLYTRNALQNAMNEMDNIEITTRAVGDITTTAAEMDVVNDKHLNELAQLNAQLNESSS